MLFLAEMNVFRWKIKTYVEYDGHEDHFHSTGHAQEVLEDHLARM